MSRAGGSSCESIPRTLGAVGATRVGGALGAAAPVPGGIPGELQTHPHDKVCKAHTRHGGRGQSPAPMAEMPTCRCMCPNLSRQKGLSADTATARGPQRSLQRRKPLSELKPQSRQIPRDEHGAGRGGRPDGIVPSFWDDEDVWEVDGADGGAASQVCSPPPRCALKTVTMGRFVRCVFYNKKKNKPSSFLVA